MSLHNFERKSFSVATRNRQLRGKKLEQFEANWDEIFGIEVFCGRVGQLIRKKPGQPCPECGGRHEEGL